MYHVDAYRLEDESEAYELGLEEYLFSQGVTLIEWPGNVSSLLPGEYLTVIIRFQGMGADSRELEFIPRGKVYDKIVKELTGSVHIGD